MRFTSSIASSRLRAVMIPSTGPKYSVRWNSDPGCTPSRMPGLQSAPECVQLLRLHDPLLARLQRGERPQQLAVGRPDEWTDLA